MEVLRCPECEAAVPPDAPDGLCPKCLLRVALEEGDDETELDALDQTIDSAPGDKAKTTAAPAPSNKRFGDYELLEEIARGGMGVVYRAKQGGLDRVVALKMILSGGLASAAEVERFQIEAQAAAKLDHPGIVPIFDVGCVDDRHYFSMAFIDGESLADKLDRGPLSDRESARLLLKIAQAVQYAHERDIIHRDLKPANILLDEGNPRITDFGLAKRMDSEAQLTVSGQALGTPSYMPPEQAAGKDSMNRVTADVYSLGAILYTMLTGGAPFKSDSLLDTLKQVMEREPDAPRDLNQEIHADLEAICLKCLEKNPEDRYATAAELVSELELFLDGKPINARQLTAWGRLQRWRRIIDRSKDVRIRSATTILGFPLVDIALGHDDEKEETFGRAVGVIAYGDVATGIVAIGGSARGVFAFGKHAYGLLPFGFTAVGLIPMGFCSLGVVSFGGFAVGVFSLAAVAIGYGSQGMVAIGPNAMGAFVWP